jgi:hypothetical protein
MSWYLYLARLIAPGKLERREYYLPRISEYLYEVVGMVHVLVLCMCHAVEFEYLACWSGTTVSTMPPSHPHCTMGG